MVHPLVRVEPMELRLKGTILEGRLMVDLPPEAPQGEVEVTVTQTEKMVDSTKRNLELLAWLKEIRKRPNSPTRTREEVDAYLQAERDSWE